MIRAFAFIVLLSPTVALTQEAQHHSGGHDASSGHHRMMESGAQPKSRDAAGPVQPGQSAFAAIQEIVELLESDPATDWSKADIDGLREHLIDMDNVTLRARVKSEPVDGGLRFIVAGEGVVKDSIQRMILAHSAVMDGVGQWRFEASATLGGADLIVRTPASERDKLRALGLMGVLTRGMHHQDHHLMIARGEHPHAH